MQFGACFAGHIHAAGPCLADDPAVSPAHMSNRIAAPAQMGAEKRYPVRAKTLLIAPLAFAAFLAGASPAWAIGEDEFLPPEQAFKYTVTADEGQLVVEWQATKGYYLYKKRMGLSAATPGVKVGESVYPQAEIHKDEYFGEQEVFRGKFQVKAPLSGAKAGDTVALKLKWQGCADAGLCYPPSVWDASVKVAARAATTADKIFDRAQPQVEEEDEYLDPDVAFVLTADAQSTNNILLNWRIADGYYLYKQRIKLEPADTAPAGGRRGSAQGRGAHRRILRHAGDLSAESRRFVLGAAGRQECRGQGDVPGLRRCRPVLSADHQTDDGFARRCAHRRGQRRRRLFHRRFRLRAGQLRRQDQERQYLPGARRRSSARDCCWRSRRACCPWFPFSRGSSPAAARIFPRGARSCSP